MVHFSRKAAARLCVYAIPWAEIRSGGAGLDLKKGNLRSALGCVDAPVQGCRPAAVSGAERCDVGAGMVGK